MQWVKLSEVKANPNNPRVIRDEKFAKLKQSIIDFPEMLEKRPLVCYTEGEHYIVLGGNMRLKALSDIGAKEIPIILADEWTEEQRAQFLIKDNVGFGEWDWNTLANEWDADKLTEWGLDLPPIDAIELEAEEDEYEMPDELQTDIVLGDLFEIGEHRLLCGDSTDSDQVAKLMNGEKIELVYTDPPYSSGGSQESGKVSGSIGARGQKTIKNDNLSTRGYRLLMNDVLALCQEAHTAFIFCDWKMWIETFDIAERAGFRVRNMLVWDKMQMGMGMPFRNQHELCLFASKIAGKIGDGGTPNVLKHNRDREAEHATPKPIGLINDMLKQIDSFNVYDPFSGGGSTMVAAHQLNRKCYGMELDPKYCQVIVDRMIKLDPTLEIKRNGQTYNRQTTDGE
jgi:DNA modification methylase